MLIWFLSVDQFSSYFFSLFVLVYGRGFSAPLGIACKRFQCTIIKIWFDHLSFPQWKIGCYFIFNFSNDCLGYSDRIFRLISPNPVISDQLLSHLVASTDFSILRVPIYTWIQHFYSFVRFVFSRRSSFFISCIYTLQRKFFHCLFTEF